MSMDECQYTFKWWLTVERRASSPAKIKKYSIKNGYVTKQIRNWKLKPTSLQTNAHVSTFNWIFSRTLLSTAKHYFIRFVWILIIYIWSIEKLRWPCCQVPTVNQILLDCKFLKETKHFKAGLQKLEHFNFLALSCIFMG